MKSRILFLFTLLCAAMVTVQSVYATAFTVTNTGDNGGVNPAPGAGTGTLRQAIVDANATAGADTITFASGVTGTILLENLLPHLADDVTIQGPGANVLTVKPFVAPFPGGAHARIFIINSGKTVTLSGLTITEGEAGGTVGAGIWNQGGH